MPSTSRNLLPLLAAALLLVASGSSRAEDWGLYAIVPVSAPATVLEVVGDQKSEGASISIARPAGGSNQKWIITPAADHFFTIHPSSAPSLVLAAAKGETRNGTFIVLEADTQKPWQQWELRKQDTGAYNLVPRHSPDQGLDDFGGRQLPGSQIDLWQNAPRDQHLQWLIKPLAGSTLPPGPGPLEPAAAGYVPPEIKPDAILRGQIKRSQFTGTKIFPGTVRDVTVFIPAQIDRAKPSCVYVKTDGYNPVEKELLETMIATKEIPPVVGVFVSPGSLPAPEPGNLPRRNRCYEYDGVDDENVRFFVEEILPFVAKEYDLNLSQSGNDRCIAGGSSGGIAAFNAAWQRPDAFSRVYANSGSFVAFRGGHEFPTLVRKFEAKPIRAYLTTGTHDMENCAGDWFLLDQEMDKALKFSGYDYSFRIIQGGHVAGYYDYYREAMAYLWKSWPEPIKAGPSAPRARDVLLPDQSWQIAAEGVHDPHGPATNSTGEVFFIEDNKIQRIGAAGKIQPFLPDAGRASALCFGPKGDLLAVSSTTGVVTSYDPAGESTQVIDATPGRYVLALPTGGLYVTGPGPNAASAVWFIKDGKKTLVDSGLKRATGLAGRPDQWLLSVADGDSRWVYSYQLNADGSLTNKERFFPLHVADWDDDAGAESVCYAKEGQMLVATRTGIQICADDGPTQIILPLPDRARVEAICLGGKDMDTLYAFTQNRIWQRKLKIHAITAATPMTRISGTPL